MRILVQPPLPEASEPSFGLHKVRVGGACEPQTLINILRPQISEAMKAAIAVVLQSAVQERGYEA